MSSILSRPGHGTFGEQLSRAILKKAEQKEEALQKASAKPEMPFTEFVKEAWHVVQPSREFKPNWHIDAICEHVEAMLRGQIRHLLINMPPRHMKSLTAAVMVQPWSWTWAPWLGWLTASYQQQLATRDSVASRWLMDSAWYRQSWGAKFSLTSDQNQKMRFQNDKSGYRIATSIEGVGTGEGGDIVLVDDPHNVKERHSTTKVAAVIQWWDESMSTRLNDPKTGHKMIVAQRIGTNDLSGHILEQGGYTHLCLPGEFNPAKRCVTVIGWQDPRTEKGELLHPERVGQEEMAAFAKTLGVAQKEAQINQNPQPDEGAMFRKEHWKIIEELPVEPVVASCRFWDVAATEDGGAYTAGVRMHKYQSGLIVVTDVQRGQWSPMTVDKMIKQTAAVDGRLVRIREEQEGGSAGPSVVANRKLGLQGYDYEGVRPLGDKATRARPFAVQQEAGNVALLVGVWNREFIDEHFAFPSPDLVKDQVDAASGAFLDVALGKRKKQASTGSVFGR